MNETVDPAEVRRQRLLREMLGGARDERRAGLVDAFAVAAILLLAAQVVADAEFGRAKPPPAAVAVAAIPEAKGTLEPHLDEKP